MIPQKPKVYLAAPFFNPEQVALVEKLEDLIERAGWDIFSPRRADNAQKMNQTIGSLKTYNMLRSISQESLIQLGVPLELRVSLANIRADTEPPKPPSHELRLQVFHDNHSNIDDSDLLLAVIDNFDAGVLWEIGYAFARHVPIVTTTAKNYGCNLMLAHSIVGHTKTLADVEKVLRIGNPALMLNKGMIEYGGAIAKIQAEFKSDFSLKEGPDERKQ